MYGINKTYRITAGHKRIIAMGIALAMLCCILPTSAFAIASDAPSAFLCGHVHDESCGFAAGSDGTPCTHVHDDTCYSTVQQCTHTHDAACGYSTDGGCTYSHVHDENCGYDAETGAGCTDVHAHDESCGTPCTHTCDSGCSVTTLSCNHTHDALCGYSEPVPGAPCSHICNILSFSGHTPGEPIGTYRASAGQSYESICAALPETLYGTLACTGGDVPIPVCWTCGNFADEAGTYTFRAELVNERCTSIAADDPQTKDVDESELPFITVAVPEQLSEVVSLCICTQVCTDGHTNADCPACTEDREACVVAPPSGQTTLLSTDTDLSPDESADNGSEGIGQQEDPLPVYDLEERELEKTAEDGAVIKVTGMLPTTAELRVEAVPVESVAEFAPEGSEVLFAYDIKIMVPSMPAEATPTDTPAEMTEYQPTAPVSVSITPPAGIPIETPVNVTHVDADNNTAPVAAQTVDGTVEFAADSFSVFIGTTQKTDYPAEMYWNGTNFYSDAACTAGNEILNGSNGTPFTTLPDLLAAIDGITTIYMKAVYTVSGTQTIGNNTYAVTLMRYSGYTGVLLNVASGGSVTMQNITVDGGNVAVSAAVISVTGGSLTIGSGAVVQNSKNTGSGGGVFLTGGVLNMNGGTISGNAGGIGGGVYMSGGTFTMESGTISGNTGDTGGGGVYIGGGTFTMESGTISDNIATSYNGGGVTLAAGAFTMNGGTISGNDCSGGGGGVYVNSRTTFNMSGGTISDNTAGNGNGVHVFESTVTITGGSAQITGADSVTNGTNPVTCHTITLVDGAPGDTGPLMTAAAVTALTVSSGSYGTNGVKTDSEAKLYIWLPADTAASSVTAAEKEFMGTSVAGADTNFYSNADYIFVDGTIETSGDGMTPDTAFKTLDAALLNADGKTIVVCGQTEITSQQTFSSAVTITSVYGGTDYRTSKTAMLMRAGGYTGSLFNVIGSLTLQEVTIDGGAEWTGTEDATLGRGTTNGGIQASASAINVSAGGFLGLNSGAVVQNNHNDIGSGNGGAVLNSGTFTINGGTMSNNSALNKGGAVYSNGVFSLNSGTLSGNSSSDADGGAVYIYDGTFTMSGGTISGNTAKYGGGGVYTHNAGSSFTMSGGTISGNYGTGGVYVCASSSFTMSGGAISDNIGSGVMVYNNAVFNMNGGTVSGNTAETGGGVQLYGDNKGEGSTFNMNGGTVSDNISTVNGGGVFVYTNGASTICRFNMSGGTISGNTVNGTTNGVRIKEGDFTLSGSPDLQDTVSLGTGYVIAVAAGGFTPTAPVKLALDADFTTGSEVVSYTDSITDAAAELAKYSLLNPVCSLMRGTGDNAQKLLLSFGGAVYLNGAGGLDTNDGSTPVSAVKTLKKAYELLTSNGGAIYICGGQVTVDGTITLSGTVYSDGTDTVIITNGSVSIWRYSQPTAHSDWKRSYIGALIDVASGHSLTLGNIELNGHRYATDTAPAVTASAALVNVESGATLTVNAGAALRNNCSSVNGGGVYVNGGALTMSGGSISGNTASNGGGGVYADTSTVTMSNGSISGNTANNGGGVYANNSTFNMSGGEVSGNTVADSGGGVFVYTDVYTNVIFTMSDGFISDNTATVGGGMYVYTNGTFNMNGGTVSGNKATGNTASNGGGVYVYTNGTFTMSDGFISGNTASNGGGVYVNGGALTMSGGSISNNTATDGCGVYVYTNGTFSMTGSPSLADEVYLQQDKSITVNDAFTPATSVHVTGVDLAEGRAIAVYASGLTPNAAMFHADTFTTAVDGQNVVLAADDATARITYTTLTAPSTLRAVLRGAAVTASSYVWQRSDDATNWTAIEGQTSSAYVTTIGDVGKHIRVVITDSGGASHETAYVTILAPVISATVPLNVTVVVGADGSFTAPSPDAYKITNNSAVDLYLTDVALAWDTVNTPAVFADYTKLGAALTLGSEYSFGGETMTYAIPAANGKINKTNGTLPLAWSFSLNGSGSGNYLRSAQTVRFATVTYTVSYIAPA